MLHYPANGKQIGICALVALLYVAVAKFGLALASDPEQVTAVWPATGFALAVLIRVGTFAWPGITLGALLANFITHEPFITASGIAVGNTLEAVIGAYLLQRMAGFNGTFERFGEVLALIFYSAGLSTLISATIGMLSLCLTHVVPWDRAGQVWILWWLGDAMGAIVVAPLLLTWSAPVQVPAPHRHVESGLFFAALLAVCAFLFIAPVVETAQVKFLVWPFFIWAPMRLGQRVTTAALIATMLCALWGATHGNYAFLADTMNGKLLLLQGFMAIVTLSGLSLGAASAERAAARKAWADASKQLQIAHDHMEQRVKERTAEVEDARQQLADKRKELRDYIDNMSTLNAKISTDGKILLAGRAGQRASGLQFSQLIGSDFLGGSWFSFDPAVHKRVSDAFARAVAGTTINYEEKVCLFGNVILDISFSLIPIFDEQNKVKYIIAEGRDITALKTAEAKLRESETKLRLLLENVGDYAIYTLNESGIITSWNRGAERIKGYHADEIIGKHISTFYTPEDAQCGRADLALKAAAAQGRFEDEGWRVRKDGSRFWANVVLTPLRDESWKLYGFAKVTRDLTERKRSEDALRQTNVELERRVRERTRQLQTAKDAADAANRAKDEFLAVVSHELRTPLTPVLGWTRMLRTHKLDEEHIAHALEVIERNVRTQSQLVEDLLDISRIITGKLRLNIRRIRLPVVIRSAVETVQPAAESKGITLSVKLSDEDYPVAGDADRLQQIVWNLLTNAIKFTPRNGHVEVRLRQVESHMEINVKDDGEGIPREFLPHLFNRFTQADSTSTRAHGGLGLGLAIVRHIAELHGGWVQADSNGKGKGAEFIVGLPLAPASQDADPSSGWRSRALRSEGEPLHNLKILVVDDEDDSREFVAVALQRCGAEVTTAASARDAFTELENIHPDILISDIGMPGEDGYALIRRIRAREREAGGCIPAIALTAYARTEDSTRILSEGFQVHVPKPVDPAELAAVVAKVAQRVWQ